MFNICIICLIFAHISMTNEWWECDQQMMITARCSLWSTFPARIDRCTHCNAAIGEWTTGYCINIEHKYKYKMQIQIQHKLMHTLHCFNWRMENCTEIQNTDNQNTNRNLALIDARIALLQLEKGNCIEIQNTDEMLLKYYHKRQINIEWRCNRNWTQHNRKHAYFLSC